MTHNINSHEEIFDTLKEILAEMFVTDKSAITMDSRLYEELDIDSIDAIDLVVRVKEITGKRINPEDFKSVRTVGDVVEAIMHLQGL